MKKIESMTLIALGAALIAALSPFQIPFGPIPITLQTLAIGLVASLFRPKEATLAVIIYLLLGAIGLPVFAGGSGGFQAFYGPTAGFLLFFPLRALVTSSLAGQKGQPILIFIANLLGEAVLFFGGAIGFMLVTHKSLEIAWTSVVLPFMIPDLIKITLTTILSVILYKNLKNLAYFDKQK